MCIRDRIAGRAAIDFDQAAAVDDHAIGRDGGEARRPVVGQTLSLIHI